MSNLKTIHPTIIAQLRNAARQGRSISGALKTAHEMLPADERNTIAMIQYAREAFGLSLHEASPIAGWVKEGKGEIPDERLDELLVPAVAAHRDQWDKIEEN